MSIYPNVFLNTICKIIGNIYKKIIEAQENSDTVIVLDFLIVVDFPCKKVHLLPILFKRFCILETMRSFSHVSFFTNSDDAHV